MVKFHIQLVVFLMCLMILSGSCGKTFTPRPRGYFRIAFPPKSYKPLDIALPYSFEIPAYSMAGRDSFNLDQLNWITIDVPANHAQIHLSYKEINNNLGTYIEQSRNLVYEHTQKASAIEEEIFEKPLKKVYGTIYTIKGNAASPLQFYLTDSIKHFLRGSLYIKEIPNIDSLQPVISFLSQDVLRIIETTEWKKNK
ncbi:MAG: gliding motility lipoprotein GldD [Mariniphaga sp.]